MKAKEKKTLALVSLGCAKNVVDLQGIAGGLLKNGYTLSPNPDRADLVVVNTCAFIASAREETEAEIVRALELKARGNYGRVVVTGCYPKRYPHSAARFPGVDGWQGVPEKWDEPAMPGLRFTGKAFAYLKIAEGCAPLRVLRHSSYPRQIPFASGSVDSERSESSVAERMSRIEYRRPRPNALWMRFRGGANVAGRFAVEDRPSSRRVLG